MGQRLRQTIHQTVHMMLLATLAWPSLAAAEAGKIKYAYDEIKGSCEEFNDTIKSRGLIDPMSNSHPGTLGWTLCQYKAELSDPKVPVGRSQKEGRTCLNIELPALELTADITVVAARWQQGRETASGGCRKELVRIDADIQAHEGHHVADCKALLNESKESWARQTHAIKVCATPGQTETALLAELQNRITDELHSLLNKLNHDMEYRTKETHEKIGYGTPGIRCTSCLP